MNDRFITKHSVGLGINRVTTSPIGRKAVIRNDKGRSNTVDASIKTRTD